MGVFSSFFFRVTSGRMVKRSQQNYGRKVSIAQAAFKATFPDKKIKHNQRQQLFFLLPFHVKFQPWEGWREPQTLRPGRALLISCRWQLSRHVAPLFAYVVGAMHLGRVRVLFAAFGHFFLMKSLWEHILYRCHGPPQKFRPVFLFFPATVRNKMWPLWEQKVWGKLMHTSWGKPGSC